MVPTAVRRRRPLVVQTLPPLRAADAQDSLVHVPAPGGRYKYLCSIHARLGGAERCTPPASDGPWTQLIALSKNVSRLCKPLLPRLTLPPTRPHPSYPRPTLSDVIGPSNRKLYRIKSFFHTLPPLRAADAQDSLMHVPAPSAGCEEIRITRRHCHGTVEAQAQAQTQGL